MSAIAKAYWRSIKRGAHTFMDVPEKLRNQVKLLAMEDLRSGVITEEQYLEWIGVGEG